MTTITLSPMPDFTASVGAPRIAAIEYPLGQTVGQPGDVAGQTAVLRAALQALMDIDRPGGVCHLPFTWPEPPKAVQMHPAEPPPISKAIMKRPWLYRKLVAGDIPGNP